MSWNGFSPPSNCLLVPTVPPWIGWFNCLYVTGELVKKNFAERLMDFIVWDMPPLVLNHYFIVQQLILHLSALKMRARSCIQKNTEEMMHGNDLRLKLVISHRSCCLACTLVKIRSHCEVGCSEGLCVKGGSFFHLAGKSHCGWEGFWELECMSADWKALWECQKSYQFITGRKYNDKTFILTFRLVGNSESSPYPT